MPVSRHPGSTSLVDVLDRVLDQGIRLADWPRVALQRGRIVVESVDTHLEAPQLPSGKTGTGA